MKRVKAVIQPGSLRFCMLHATHNGDSDPNHHHLLELDPTDRLDWFNFSLPHSFQPLNIILSKQN